MIAIRWDLFNIRGVPRDIVDHMASVSASDWIYFIGDYGYGILYTQLVSKNWKVDSRNLYEYFHIHLLVNTGIVIFTLNVNSEFNVQANYR